MIVIDFHEGMINATSPPRATRPKEDNFLSMILGKVVGSGKNEPMPQPPQGEKKESGSPRRNNFTLTSMILEGRKQRKKSE